MLKAFLKALGFNPCEHQYEIIDIAKFSTSFMGAKIDYSTVYTNRCKHCGRMKHYTVKT